MKNEPLNSNQYAALFAMKTVLEANPNRRWVHKKEIAAEFAIDTRTLTAVLSSLISKGYITCRTLKKRQKGYALLETAAGWLGVKNAKMLVNHPSTPKKDSAVNLYIYNPKKSEGDKQGKKQAEPPAPPHRDKYLEAVAAYPHRLSGEKGLHEGEKHWNKLVGDKDEGGDAICPDFIIAMIGRYAAMPVDRKYRKRFASFLKARLFLDYAQGADDEMIADNPHLALANITGDLIEKFAENDKGLAAALDTVAFVDYARATNRLTLSFRAKGIPHDSVMRLYSLERHYKKGMSSYYGDQIEKVIFAEI